MVPATVILAFSHLIALPVEPLVGGPFCPGQRTVGFLVLSVPLGLGLWGGRCRDVSIWLTAPARALPGSDSKGPRSLKPDWGKPFYPVSGIGTLIGLVERAAVFGFMALNDRGVAAFVGAWIIVELASGWNRERGSPSEDAKRAVWQARTMVALILNLCSMYYGILAYYVCAGPPSMFGG